MSELSSQTPDTPLEHFDLIEDVIAHIRTKMPADTGPASWKNVCEDVLHCELSAIEPLLLQELAEADGDLEKQEKTRALLRAVSWYRHPRMSTEALLTEITRLRTTLSAVEDTTALDTVQEALAEQHEGHEVLRAADAIDGLFTRANASAEQITLRGIRDQVYYQLLYPHWFEVVKRWTASQTTRI